MKYWYQRPHISIAGHVRTVIVLEGSSNPDDTQLPLFTNGMSALFCQINNDVQPNQKTANTILFGTSIPSENLDVAENNTVIIYFFKPFLLASIFKISAQELKEKAINLSAWNAQKNIALNHQLLNAANTNSAIEILDYFIAQHIESNRKECEIISHSTDLMMENSDTEILSQLLEKLQLTERTFQRIFKKYVGITPNQYRRICQFQFAFSQLKGNHFEKLTDVAYGNGYFDQSHYIRSFKEFTDTTPNEYLQSGLKKKK